MTVFDDLEAFDAKQESDLLLVVAILLRCRQENEGTGVHTAACRLLTGRLVHSKRGRPKGGRA